ncbi:peptidyl-tRNA hydrolase [Dethiosulfatibacter aminovorans DSM 17477]|uniref:Peptidyl-tRNA hydrolase n=1 Tax=Dethiosulfatibacter aminovorans DSM 17477 TaxID=1121476 RepID=A0A1M6KCA2_9FIRM|nr:aminoacyl-tRNA hydrolase [Dethiosulfatibacter aminovorans]SHJ56616.1 peptidyl-tRNA hydrolase [Dethiosulfatibacter aminovorans DSM 17477]
MYLVVGLGNPGKQYAGTRHNIGFEVIDYICSEKDIKLDKMKFNAVYGEYRIKGEKVLLAKPLTYMNRSGIAVLDISRYYKIDPENIIVIYDDIDLAPGKLRIRPNGSAGTHNGMKSIIYQLQTEDFSRIRVGIGRNKQMDLASFVLQKFSEAEIEQLTDTVKNAALAVDEIIENSVDSAMNKYNIK